jgi:hypothetical protein
MDEMTDLKRRAGIITEDDGFDPVQNWVNGNQADVRRYIGGNPATAAQLGLAIWEELGDDHLRQFLTHLTRV